MPVLSYLGFFEFKTLLPVLAGNQPMFPVIGFGSQITITSFCTGLSPSYIRVFPKIEHSGSAVRVALEQNKFSKKLPPTGIEPGTLGL